MGAYHDKNGLSGAIKYLGQRPKIVVPVNVPWGVSASLPTGCIRETPPFH